MKDDLRQVKINKYINSKKVKAFIIEKYLAILSLASNLEFIMQHKRFVHHKLSIKPLF